MNILYGHVEVILSFTYPKCVYVSVRKHFFVRFGLNMEHDKKNILNTELFFFVYVILSGSK